jgi:hypothetical protein
LGKAMVKSPTPNPLSKSTTIKSWHSRLMYHSTIAQILCLNYVLNFIIYFYNFEFYNLFLHFFKGCGGGNMYIFNFTIYLYINPKIDDPKPCKV